MGGVVEKVQFMIVTNTNLHYHEFYCAYICTTDFITHDSVD